MTRSRLLPALAVVLEGCLAGAASMRMAASRFHRVLRTALCAATILTGSCGSSVEPLPQGGVHVLFVGNSLTYTNDLPGTLAAIAASNGDTVRVASSVGPDLAIIDHLNGGSNAVDELKLGGWSYVILQQGPTPAGICRDSLVLWTKLFAPLIQAAGAKTAVLMTWPGVGYQNLWDEVRVSFQEAAVSVHGVFMPAGAAWRAAWASDSTLAFYGPDGYHPSPLGTFVTALEIYERVTGHDARTLPTKAFANGQQFTLPEATIRLLQAAAHAANEQYAADSAPLPAELAAPSKYVPTAPGC